MPHAYRDPFEKTPEPPDSTPNFDELRKRRGKRIAVVSAVLVVAIATAGGGATIAAQRATKRATESAARNLQTCMMHGPLEPFETPSLRARRLQLASMSIPDAERTLPTARVWPLECRDVARVAVDAFKEANAAEATLKPLRDLATQLDSPSAISLDLSALVDAAIGTLDRELGLASKAPIASAQTPLPIAPMTVDALSKLPPLSKEGTSLGHVFTEDNPGLSLPVLLDEKDLPESPLLCAFHASDAEVPCRSLRELKSAQQHGLRLLGSSDPEAKTLIFAGQRGSEGIFQTGSGTFVDRLYSYGGYAKKDGSIALLGWDDKEKKLVLSRSEKNGPAVRLTLKPDFRVGNYFYGSQILWDQVLVRGVTKDNERRLFVLPLAEADKRTFELADVGELPEPGLIREGEEESPHLTGCRAEQMIVVRVRGRGSDFLTFRLKDNTFSKPVVAPPFGVLGCHGTTATIVRVEHGRAPSPLLYHDACTSAGCTRTALKNDILDRGASDLKTLDAKRIAAVDLAGKLLVVWSAGERGGLRMRLGAPGAFDRASDIVLLDDHVGDGKVTADSMVLGFRLFSRENFAVLLLSTVAGLHAFRIDPDGTARPWAVHHDPAK